MMLLLWGTIVKGIKEGNSACAVIILLYIKFEKHIQIKSAVTEDDMVPGADNELWLPGYSRVPHGEPSCPDWSPVPRHSLAVWPVHYILPIKRLAPLDVTFS